MIFLSDGEASDEDEVIAEIRALEQSMVYCAGLGIGEATRQLDRFFSDGVYGVDAHTLARRFAPLLRRLLRR